MKKRILFFVICIFSSFFLFAQNVNYVIGKADSPVQTVSWSPDGSLFATSGNNFVLLWFSDTNTTKSFLVEHGVPVVASNFSRDGKFFLSVGNDNSVIVRSVNSSSVATKIKVNSAFPVSDADFIAENGFSLCFATNGRTLSGFFRLMETQSFVERKICSVPSAIYSVDSNFNGTRILVSSVEGRSYVIDTNSGEIIKDVPSYSKSNIKARFSPNGKEFVCAVGKTTLSISYSEKVGGRVIHDADGFLNAAVFAPDGKSIACATGAGSVKIFNAESCQIENKYFLVDGSDMVLSLAYSPDGEFLLAGTKNGFIYRWSISGKVWDEKNKKYVDVDKEKLDNPQNQDIKDLAQELKNQLKNQKSNSNNGENSSLSFNNSSPENQKANNSQPLVQKENDFDVLYKKGHCLIIDLGVTLPPSHYNLEFSAGLGYLNYELIQPFYFGGVIKPFMAFATGSFPYSYTLNGQPMASPKLTGAKIYAPLGFVFYPFFDHVEVFAEIDAGLSLNWLWNAKLGAEALWSDPFSSFYGAVKVGAGWRFIRFSVAGEYDQVLGLSFTAEVGCNIKLGGKKEKN